MAGRLAARLRSLVGRRARRLLGWLDGLLQVLVPPRPTRCAWLSTPDYVGSANHLFRHVLATRSNLDHVWLVTDAGVADAIRADVERLDGTARGHRVRVVARHSPAGYWAYLRSRWVFHTHGVYRWVHRAVRRECVSLWHGMPIKAIGALNTVTPNPHPTFGTLHLATSPFFRDVIARAFRASPDDVLVCGLPRCDVLHGCTPVARDGDEVRAALDVPDGDRLVLWMPTYRTTHARMHTTSGVAGFHTFLDDLTPDQWRAVDRAAARAGARVLVKPHPYDPLNDVDRDPGRDLGLDRVRLVRSPAWLALGIELYDALAATDGLISDISSVLVDWVPTGRPLGMVGFDADAYVRDVVVDPARLQASRRIADLADPQQREAFFGAVASGARCPADQDDLSDWLYPRDMVDGCEAVLAAVGVGGR